MPRSREVQDLLDQFITLEGANQVYGFITRHRAEAAEILKTERHPLGGVIAGSLFELFGYDYQRRKQGERRLLTTPRVTLDLYSAVTDMPKQTAPAANDAVTTGIRGISVPDGIEMELGTVRTIRRLHEYKAMQNPEAIVQQMRALTNPNFVCANLRLEYFQGQSRGGRILGALLNNGDQRPLTLDPDYEVNYSAPQNSVLRQVRLPRLVSVDYLPLHTLLLYELTQVLAEEALAKELVVPVTPRVLTQMGFRS